MSKFLKTWLAMSAVIIAADVLLGVDFWEMLGPVGSLMFWFGIGLCCGVWSHYWEQRA
jgi:hypothetical protein